VLFWRTRYAIHSFYVFGNVQCHRIGPDKSTLVDILCLDRVQKDSSQDGDMVDQGRFKSSFWSLLCICFIERHNMGEQSSTPFHDTVVRSRTNTAAQQMQETLSPFVQKTMLVVRCPR